MNEATLASHKLMVEVPILFPFAFAAFVAIYGDVTPNHYALLSLSKLHHTVTNHG